MAACRALGHTDVWCGGVGGPDGRRRGQDSEEVPGSPLGDATREEPWQHRDMCEGRLPGP